MVFFLSRRLWSGFAIATIPIVMQYESDFGQVCLLQVFQIVGFDVDEVFWNLRERNAECKQVVYFAKHRR